MTLDFMVTPGLHFPISTHRVWILDTVPESIWALVKCLSAAEAGKVEGTPFLHPDVGANGNCGFLRHPTPK